MQPLDYIFMNLIHLDSETSVHLSQLKQLVNFIHNDTILEVYMNINEERREILLFVLKSEFIRLQGHQARSSPLHLSTIDIVDTLLRTFLY